MAEPTINPYNFVPLPPGEPQRSAFPGWHRLHGKSYSGQLHCVLEAISPLFSADHQRAQARSPQERQQMFPFLRNSQGQPYIQSTSLKGMIRAVYEALTASCLPLTNTTGTSKHAGKDVPYTLESLGLYEHDECNGPTQLCAACNLFGVIHGDALHAQGRVMFTDAVLQDGTLEAGEILLPELSSPKPHHYPIYSKTHGVRGAIAGRKFFYHHNPRAALGVEAGQWRTRAHGMTEVAAPGTRFCFQVTMHNLTAAEVAELLACLELEPTLGHKIGMGKPVGFGSCRIYIVPEKSSLSRGGARYQAWQHSATPLDVEGLKAPSRPFPKELREVLRLNKYQDGSIGYLSYGSYTGKGIDAQGRYIEVRASTAAPGAASARSNTPTRPTPGGGMNLGDVMVQAQARQGKSREKATPGRTFKKGEKISVEVVARDGQRLTLRIVDTGQELVHEALYPPPWQPGERKRVVIDDLESDGRIKKIRP